MAIKATLIALPTSSSSQSDSAEVIFAEFPSFGSLQDAVKAEAPEHFSDLVDNLETDDLSDYEADYEVNGSLTIEASIEGDRTGLIIFEPVTIY